VRASLAPLVLLAASVAACGGGGAPGPPPASRVLPALVALDAAENPPIVDGALTDTAWSRATELVLPLDGRVKGVRLKAAYDADTLYLLAIWDDPERSMNRYWTDRGGLKWELRTAEDMFALCLAPGTETAAFREQGCALFCHDGRHVWPTPGTEIVDYWRWGAQSTAWHPEARDLFLRQGAEHRLRGDNQPGESDNIPNRSDEYFGPAYYPYYIRDHADRILFADNARPVSKEWKATKLAGPANEGRRIPYDVLRARSGSRGDVRAASKHHEGKVWVLELSRRLRTGEPDDLGVGDPLVPALFAVAICNDQEDKDHALSGPVELRFARAPTAGKKE